MEAALVALIVLSLTFVTLLAAALILKIPRRKPSADEVNRRSPYSVAWLTFGQFRTYKKNLAKNLSNLQPLLDLGTRHDVYILSQKDDGYAEDEADIRGTFAEFGMNVGWIRYWDDVEEEHPIPGAIIERYRSMSSRLPEGSSAFMPRMWWRRHVLYDMFRSSDGGPYDLVWFSRLFDTSIDVLELSFFQDVTVLDESEVIGCVDTLFAGSPNAMQHVFDFGKTQPIVDERMWNEKQFVRFFSSFDKVLAENRPTLSSEAQVSHFLFNSEKVKFRSVRKDFNHPAGPSETASLLVKINKH